jgi:alpha-tubulin suppressor-like RCC1 family protein
VTVRTSIWLSAAVLALVPVGASAATPSISAAASASAALRADGTVFTWGDNHYGQLGSGTTTDRTLPAQLGGLTSVAAVEAGYAHMLVLKDNGTVWAWGFNGFGGLGDNTTTDRHAPVQVSGLTGVTALSAGWDYSMALKSNGTVWAWGYNRYGGLGDGTTFSRSLPVQVVGLTNVVAIAGGGEHALALKNDGTVWAWGRNISGQLGDNSSTDHSTPVQVSGLTGVRAIAAGHAYSLALKSDGTVWGWGFNTSGQLGDGTSNTRFAPVQASGLTSVAAISSGAYHALALKSDGRVWAWGYNLVGQLGDGTSTDRNIPVQVSGLTGVVAISAGATDFGQGHSLALKNDGTVWGWGYNFPGQLGDGTTNERSLPVAVHAASGTGPLNLGASSSFRVVAPVVVSGGRVSVTANASFPPQFVGRRIYLFAYAPSSLVHTLLGLPEKAGQCVLAQIDASGFSSASGGLQYGNSVIDAATQAISMITNVLVSQVAGSTLCVGVGNTGTEATTPGNFICPATILDSSGAACQPPGSETTTDPGGGSIAKTLGSRATVSPAATLYGGFELASASSVYVLVRGNSLGTLGVTQGFLDTPRVRLYNSGGQDILADANGAGFNGCAANAVFQGPVVNYYTSVRGQPPHSRDACAAQSLGAGAYTFSVTPSSAGVTSSPNAGQVLFEVVLGNGSGATTNTLGSRATVSPTATHFGGFELASAATVYMLVRGNSLGTLGVTQSFLDLPRVRIYDSQGRDLVTTSGGTAGFNGCYVGNQSGDAVINYYSNVRHQPAQQRDACISMPLSPGVYTFSVTPSIMGVTTTDAVSAPSSGEVLFEVTLH